jgi:hypothetical protein
MAEPKRSNLNLSYNRVVPKFLQGLVQDSKTANEEQQKVLALKRAQLEIDQDGDVERDEDMPVVVGMTEEVQPGKRIKVDISDQSVLDKLEDQGYRTERTVGRIGSAKEEEEAAAGGGQKSKILEMTSKKFSQKPSTSSNSTTSKLDDPDKSDDKKKKKKGTKNLLSFNPDR